jgi:hypothetical protein
MRRRCKQCQRKTEHIQRGLNNHNARYECLICGYIVEGYGNL